MAKDKICVSSIIYGMIDPLCYESHLNLLYRLGKDLPEYDIIFHGPWRQQIDQGRNNAAKVAMASECKWLFFYDSDMFLRDPGIVKRLMAYDKPMIMDHAFIRGMPFEPMMFRFVDEGKTRLGKYQPTKEEYEVGGLLRVDAAGTCATLINVDLFRHMTEPYFITAAGFTEDVYFCMKARHQVEGFECYVDLESYKAGKDVGHLMDPIPVCSDNVEELRTFYGAGFNSSGLSCPELKKKGPNPNPLEEGNG